MRTLEGSPTPPAMVRGRQSRPAPHAVCLRTCSIGLMAGLFLFAACGMNEGGRCQIDSDCASGLICKEASTGNGTCGHQGSITSDAASVTAAGPEAGPEAASSTQSTIDTSVPNASVLDATDLDVGMLDDGAVDAGGLDSTATETD